MNTENQSADTAPVHGALQLPYEALPERPVREDLRNLTRQETIKRGKESYYVNIQDIVIREGFNGRLNIEGLSEEEYQEKQLLIPESALSLYTGGYPPPALKGDFTKEGKFIPTEGHRRSYMIKWLLANGYTTWEKTGEKIEMVEVEILPKEYTELDRAKMVIHSQNNLKLTALEYGYHFRRLNEVFNVSHEDIAKEFNGMRSRQWVTNMIALTNLPKDVQIQIQKGNLTTTAALALKSSVKDEGELSKIVQDSVDSGETISVKQAQATKTAAPEPPPFDSAPIRIEMHGFVNQFEEKVIDFDKASEEIAACTDKYCEIYPNDHIAIRGYCVVSMELLRKLRDIPSKELNAPAAEEDETPAQEPNTDQAPAAPGPMRYETDAADEVEEDSHKTSAKAPVVAPKSQKDVLPPIDFSHEKQEGIMDLSEAIGLCDKVIVRLKNVVMPAQHRNDLEQYLGWIIGKCSKAKEILTKAADER